MKIQCNGIVLNYEKSGEGSPLLLLHGNGEDLHIFDELCIALKHSFTIYAVDSRNHGASERSEDYRYETMVEDVHAFINALQLTSVYLLGFSDGAIIGLLLAKQYPSCIRKMMLLGINLSPNDFLPSVYHEIQEEYKETRNPLLKLMLEEPQIDPLLLHDIKTPTLIVGGEHDVFPLSTFQRVADGLVNASLLIMKDHTHDSYIVHQDILAFDILHFFMKSK